MLTERALTETGFNWVECSFAVGLPCLVAACLAFTDRDRRALAWYFGGAALFAFGLATASFPFFLAARSRACGIMPIRDRTR